MLARAIVLQQKTQRPVQFEITEPTRVTLPHFLDSSALEIRCF
jgi:hypothetical protein